MLGKQKTENPKNKVSSLVSGYRVNVELLSESQKHQLLMFINVKDLVAKCYVF